MSGALGVVRDVVGLVLLLAGLVVCGLGVLALLRMPDVYLRMNTASKAVTAGVALTLFGAAALSEAPLWLKAIGTTFFLLFTTPIAAFSAARAAHRRRSPKAGCTEVDELEDATRSEGR